LVKWKSTLQMVFVKLKLITARCQSLKKLFWPYIYRSKLPRNILLYNCAVPTSELHEIAETFMDKWPILGIFLEESDITFTICIFLQLFDSNHLFLLRGFLPRLFNNFCHRIERGDFNLTFCAWAHFLLHSDYWILEN